MKQSRQPQHAVNEGIRHSKIRLIDPEGEMLGVFSVNEALAKASQYNLDLVEISPQADPPVCKIMDYGKFRYEAQKKQKEAKKNQKVIQTKEVKIRVNIAEHDYQVKLRHAREFIEDKNKVKFSLRFRGREITHNDLARNLFNRYYEDMKDIAKIEQEAKMEGRQMIMVLTAI